MNIHAVAKEFGELSRRGLAQSGYFGRDRCFRGSEGPRTGRTKDTDKNRGTDTNGGWLLRGPLETVLVDEALVAWLATKVEEETYFEGRRRQLAEHLRLALEAELGARFGFHDDGLVNDHVDPLPGQRFAAKVDHDRDFAIDAVSLGYQIALHGQRIDPLAKAEAERATDIE